MLTSPIWDLYIPIFTIGVLVILLSFAINFFGFSKPRRILNGKPIFQSALDIACQTLAQGTDYQFRSSIFLLSSKKNETIEMYFHSRNMTGEPDAGIKFTKGTGCTGLSWEGRSIKIADLTIADSDMEKEWGMTKDQIARTQQLKSIICIPIISANSDDVIIGIFSVDSSAPAAEFFERASVRSTLIPFAELIGILLVTLDLAFPLE